MKNSLTRRLDTKDPKAVVSEALEQKKDASLALFESYMGNPERREYVESLEASINDPKKRKIALETMTVVDNTVRMFENMMKEGVNEATISNYFGNTPRDVVKLIRYTNANTNINSWMDVQAQDTLRGIVYYIDTVATKTKKEGDIVEGQDVPDSLSQYFATETATIGLVGTLGVYVGTSTFGSGGSGSGLRPSTVQLVSIYTGADANLLGTRKVIAHDDGNGGFTPAEGVLTAETISAGSIDYVTGVFADIAFNGAVVNLVDYDVKAEFNWDSEQDVDEHAEQDLILSYKDITATFHPLGFKLSATANLLLDKSLGQKTEGILESVALDKLLTETDNIGAEAIYRMSCMTDALTFDTANATAHSPKDHAQSLYVAIGQIQASMTINNNRGGIDFIIAGATAESYMVYLDKYVKDTSQRRVGGYKAGTLDGIPVFVSNIVPQDTLVAGWQGTSDGDSPMIYSPVAQIATPTLTTKDFISQKGVGSFYALTPMKKSHQYYRRLRLLNLPTL